MIEVAIMIEGQNGLNWNRWKKIARTVEDAGFAGLYRSDHFINPNPPDKASLELWVSLTWLASNTTRIEFGPLVSPVSFRHPTMTARMAAAVDDLSGGRLILGMGAGWMEREHTNFGWELLDIPDRFIRFEEALIVVSKLLKSDQPVNFEGSYYQLNEAILLPRPERYQGPPILIGGNGQNRTLPLVVQYASEWNGVHLPPDEFHQLNLHLDQLSIAADRDPKKIKRSLMVSCEFGRNEREVASLVEKRTADKLTSEELRHKYGAVIGTPNQIVDHLGKLAEVGCQRVMLQWLALDDLERLEAMAASVLPQVQT